MAFLTETAQWEAGVYRLETNDPVLGGENGPSNAAAKQLANRTLYLKGLIDAINGNYATEAFVTSAVAALVDSSPGALDTLNELAAALGDDPNFAASVTGALGGKQPLDGTLTALAALTTSANQMVYATGLDSFALTPLSTFARSLLDDASAESMRTTLGLGDLSIQSIATAFGNSLTASGYQQLPGGLILQWGSLGAIFNSTNINITFPITFPAAALSLSGLVSMSGSVTGSISPVLISHSASGAVFQGDFSTDTGSGTLYWMAVGH